MSQAIGTVSESDVQKLLVAQTHLGARNIDPSMESYIFKRRNDGVHIFNLQKTWEKLSLAARIIVAIENPADVCVVSGAQHGQRAVLKFAKYTGATAYAGRYTPGTFTNQTQNTFFEPRLLIVTDPRVDHQPLKDSSYVNVPTIAFCNSDSPLKYVDVAIPCNNTGVHSIGLMWWFLCREVLFLRNRGGASRNWDVMPDLFFFRDVDEQEKDEQRNKASNENDNQFQTTESNQNEFNQPTWGDEVEAVPTGKKGTANWDNSAIQSWQPN